MVTVYTFPECPFCTQLKELLTNESIEFKDVNVNLPENKEEYDKVTEASKCFEVPVVKIGKQLLIPNVSFFSIPEAVTLTKNFLA